MTRPPPIDWHAVAAQWREHLAECVRQGNTTAVRWAETHVTWAEGFARKQGKADE